MPTFDASGIHLRRWLAAACRKEKKEKNPPDEETDDTLRQWRIESKIEAMTTTAGLGSVITYASKSHKTLLRVVSQVWPTTALARVCQFK